MNPVRTGFFDSLAIKNIVKIDFFQYCVGSDSMFYCAEAVLLTKDMEFSKHSAVISFFGKEFIKTEILPQELHRYLIGSFRERERSDYDVLIFPEREEAEEILENAEIFIREVKNYLREKGYHV